MSVSRRFTTADLDRGVYARAGVAEYCLVDIAGQCAQVYPRSASGLRLVQTLTGDDTLTSPLLPGFSLAVGTIWPPEWLPGPGAEHAED